MDPSTDPLPHVKLLRDFRELKLAPRRDSTTSKSLESGAKVSQGASIADMTRTGHLPDQWPRDEWHQSVRLSMRSSNKLNCFQLVLVHFLRLLSIGLFSSGVAVAFSPDAHSSLSALDITSKSNQNEESTRTLPSSCPNVGTSLHKHLLQVYLFLTLFVLL